MLLTVIIVTKNPGDDIYLTLSSLKVLNDPSVEILMKDNSSDKTLENLNDFFGFSNFRYIHSDDKGIYDAMNQAIEHANGEFIYFLNAGDLYMDCGLLKHLKNDDGEAGFHFGNIISLHPFVRLLRYSGYINKYSVYLRRVCHQGIVFKKDVFDKLGRFDVNLQVNADHLFILRLVDRFKGKSLNRFIAIYKGGGKSYGYKLSKQEKSYMNKKLAGIFNVVEIGFLKFASLFVAIILYVKNFNKPI